MAEKIQGQKVTEQQVAEWVDEAEKGYDVDALLQRGRGRPGRGASPSQVIAVRFTPEEIEEIDARARERNISRSELIREAVL
ncbi:ribbon-helix-helix domain-containing protein [Corynebacterium cystitidis]|uniref:ribbon-helix-helix domain-containing protein n=1 Tax=Corynebacterium cystitidis TaxID=35757 RepID=UPI00211DF73F|nr:CopG family transcriptional regulator [Corynebacterium cystitidis]